jgi:hypothetical protein
MDAAMKRAIIALSALAIFAKQNKKLTAYKST